MKFKSALIYISVLSVFTITCGRHHGKFHSIATPVIALDNLQGDPFTLLGITISNPDNGSYYQAVWDLGNGFKISAPAVNQDDPAKIWISVPIGVYSSANVFDSGQAQVQINKSKNGGSAISAPISFSILPAPSNIWGLGIPSSGLLVSLETAGRHGIGDAELLKTTTNNPLAIYPILADSITAFLGSSYVRMTLDNALAGNTTSFGLVNGRQIVFNSNSLEFSDRAILALNAAVAQAGGFPPPNPDPDNIWNFYSALAHDPSVSFVADYSRIIAGAALTSLNIIAHLNSSNSSGLKDYQLGAIAWIGVAAAVAGQDFYLDAVAGRGLNGKDQFDQLTGAVLWLNNQLATVAEYHFNQSRLRGIYGTKLAIAGDQINEGIEANATLANELSYGFIKGYLPIDGLLASGFAIAITVNQQSGSYTVKAEADTSNGQPVSGAPLSLIVLRSDGFEFVDIGVTDSNGEIIFSPVGFGSSGTVDCINVIHSGGTAQVSALMFF